MLSQTPASRAATQQVSALYLRKLGLRGFRKCALETGRLVPGEEFRAKHLGWGQKARTEEHPGRPLNKGRVTALTQGLQGQTDKA